MKALTPALQSYAWGKIGRDSEVYNLYSEGRESNLDEAKPYAELWMGTHPSGPSNIVEADGKDTLLNDYIGNHPEVLGEGVIKHFGKQLPFLFKVLSVNKALSIQAHPNKKHAEDLHAAKPEIYKDANHKPEMAIALTPFEALCGFRSVDEVVGFFTALPELVAVVGKQTAEELSSGGDKLNALKSTFRSLMTCPQERVTEQIQLILKRFDTLPDNDTLSPLFRRLNEEFPNDVGCFCIYFMNYVTLQPGESLFLEANLIHAYLKGDCIECMACSDNVVRAGLTPKFKDVETLCSMLNYERKTPEMTLFKPHRRNSNVVDYVPPIRDFAVQMIECPARGSVELDSLSSASLLLFITGKGCLTSTGDALESQSVRRGSVIFIEARHNLRFESQSDEALLAFRAYCDAH